MLSSDKKENNSTNKDLKEDSTNIENNKTSFLTLKCLSEEAKKLDNSVKILAFLRYICKKELFENKLQSKEFLNNFYVKLNFDNNDVVSCEYEIKDKFVSKDNLRYIMGDFVTYKNSVLQKEIDLYFKDKEYLPLKEQYDRFFKKIDLSLEKKQYLYLQEKFEAWFNQIDNSKTTKMCLIFINNLEEIFKSEVPFSQLEVTDKSLSNIDTNSNSNIISNIDTNSNSNSNSNIISNIDTNSNSNSNSNIIRNSIIGIAIFLIIAGIVFICIKKSNSNNESKNKENDNKIYNII